MEASVEIAKLCESWWERLSDSTRVDHQRHAEQFLGLLGWKDPVLLNTGSPDPALSSVSFVLRAAQNATAAHFMMPGSLEPPSSLVERGLDFCQSTRFLVNGTRKLNVGYAFITDMHRAYLYDVSTDELLLHSDTPEGFNREIAGFLTREAIERGALEEIRRNPRSWAARQLRECCHHWCEMLMGELGQSKESALILIDRLLVLRYLFDHDILKRSGWQLRNRFSDITQSAFSESHEHCGKALVDLFHDIWSDWKADLFRPIPDLDGALASSPYSGLMLREFALLSKTKFAIATILENFNFGDASEKARVRLVPKSDEEREGFLARQTLETVDDARLEVDLLDEGYRAIFYWFDRIVELYDRLAIEFDARAYTAKASGAEMDLFAWSEVDSHRPTALRDRFQYAIEHGLTFYCASPRQFRTARLMLYLHVISAYKESKQRFVKFPPIEQALVERPKRLESKKKWLYSPPPDPNDDGWDIA